MSITKLKSVVVVSLCLVMALCGTVPGRAQTTPQYAVAFAYKGGVRVASLASDNTWSFHDLSNTETFFNTEGPYWNPIWSSDGHIMYVTVLPPMSDARQTRWIYAYNLLTQTFTPVLPLTPLPDDNNDYCSHDHGGGGLDWLSPDGRYGLLRHTCADLDLTSQTQFVDLKQKKIVVDRLNCSSKVSDYLPNLQRIVFEGECGTMSKNYSLSLIDMRSWTPLISLEAGGPVFRFQNISTILGASPYLLVTDCPSDGSGPTINRFSLATGQRETLARLASDPGCDSTFGATVSPDNNFAAITYNGRLLRQDLTTFKVQDIGSVDSSAEPLYNSGEFTVTSAPPCLDLLTSLYQGGYDNPQPNGKNLIYVQCEVNGSTLELSQVIVTRTARMDSVIYQGPLPRKNGMAVVPLPTSQPVSTAYYVLTSDDTTLNVRAITLNGTQRSEKMVYTGPNPGTENWSLNTFFAAQFNGDKPYVAFDGPTGLVWSSQTALPSSTATFVSAAWVNGPWFTLNLTDKQCRGGCETLVNPTTDEIVRAPQAHAHFLSASPDDSWWIYGIYPTDQVDDQTPARQLIAFQRRTNTIIQISDQPMQPDHYYGYSNIIWSLPPHL